MKAPELFNRIAEKSGYTDHGIVAEVYYGLLKTITEELRAGRTVRLPELGDFSIRKWKSMNTYRFANQSMGGGVIKREGIKVVKFKPCANIGKYFNAMD